MSHNTHLHLLTHVLICCALTVAYTLLSCSFLYSCLNLFCIKSLLRRTAGEHRIHSTCQVFKCYYERQQNEQTDFRGSSSGVRRFPLAGFKANDRKTARITPWPAAPDVPDLITPALLSLDSNHVIIKHSPSWTPTTISDRGQIHKRHVLLSPQTKK